MVLILKIIVKYFLIEEENNKVFHANEDLKDQTDEVKRKVDTLQRHIDGGKQRATSY